MNPHRRVCASRVALLRRTINIYKKKRKEKMPLPAGKAPTRLSAPSAGGGDSKERVRFTELQETLARCVSQNDCVALRSLLDSVEDNPTLLGCLLNTPIPNAVWRRFE